MSETTPTINEPWHEPGQLEHKFNAPSPVWARILIRGDDVHSGVTDSGYTKLDVVPFVGMTVPWHSQLLGNTVALTVVMVENAIEDIAPTDLRQNVYILHCSS